MDRSRVSEAYITEWTDTNQKGKLFSNIQCSQHQISLEIFLVSESLSAPASCSGGPGFKSRPRGRLSWLKML
jgi:hypothetical protein